MNMKKTLILPGLVGLSAFAATAGGSLVSAVGAHADTATTASTTQTTQATQQPPQQDWSKSGHQANGKTEELLTGDKLTKATDAAKAAQPDATVKRVETDADGNGVYEVHMQKSDGSIITLALDEDFKVVATNEGMGMKPAADNGPRGDSQDQNTPNDSAVKDTTSQSQAN
jgi:hypothetical protein